MPRRDGRPGRAALAGCLAVLLAAAVGGAGGAAGQDGAPAGAPAGEAAAGPAGEPAAPRYYRARVVLTDLAEGREPAVHEVRLFRRDHRVRVVTGEAPDGRFGPETLYDYDRNELYRPLAEDRIVFAYPLSEVDRLLAKIQGFTTVPEGEPVYRLEANPDVTFDGHPCTLVLTGFATPAGIHALRWVWEARDLGGQPVKVVFPPGDGTVQIVEHHEASAAPFDDALVDLPPDLPVMSGF